MTPTNRKHRKHSWLREHSLSLAIAAVLLTCSWLFRRADPTTRLGAFYGNAVADWLGSLVLVVGTKFWYERGSAESRRPSALRGRVPKVLHDHSLTVFLLLMWIGWIWWYARIADPNGKTGQVVGNIVSEWSQIISLVWFTKYLIEKGSKESRRS